MMYNPFLLKGKNILVTGASSGIGRAIAIECSKLGANIILTARNKERLNETLELMDNAEVHQILIADLKTDDGVTAIVEAIDVKLDGIVQCAGFTIAKPFLFLSKADMQEIMKVNFESPVLLTQRIAKRKMLNKGSSIVFVSSISGVYISSVSGGLYSASKAAVNGIMKNMALELAPKSIRVNSVNPGMIDTGIFNDSMISQDLLDEDVKRYPLKRYGKPEEVAYAVIYLLSDASKWVTGSNLVIDGGFTLQ